VTFAQFKDLCNTDDTVYCISNGYTPYVYMQHPCHGFCWVAENGLDRLDRAVFWQKADADAERLCLIGKAQATT